MTDEEMKNSLERHKLWQSGFDAGFKAGYKSPRDWTPCADGLPEIMKRVIVTICGEIVIAEREHELDDDETTPIHWYDDEGCRFNDDVVTAWIPLPEPWTGGLDGK